jgi:hypothetical protein
MSQKPPRVSVYSVTDTMITIKFEIQIDGDSPDQLVIKKNGVALATVWPAEYSNGVDSWSEPRTGQKEIWYYTVHCVYGADHPEGAGEKLAGVHVLPPPQAQQPDPVQPPGVTITGHDWVPQGARVGLSVRWTSKRYYKKFLVEYWQAGGATPQHEHPGGTSGGFLFSGILPGNNVMVRVEGPRRCPCGRRRNRCVNT